MSSCNFFSDPIILNSSCIDLDLPTGSQVVDELCSLIPAPSQKYNLKNSLDLLTARKTMLPVNDAVFNSDSQYSFIDDVVIPNDHPKCFERLEECAPESTNCQSSQCMIFRDSPSSLRNTSSIFSDMKSQYLRPPGQIDDTSSLHDSLDDDEDKRAATSPNDSFVYYSDGLFLPIDDDEFALVQPDPHDFGNNYTVQTGVNPSLSTTTCNHISPHHRSLSFSSGKPNKQTLPPVEQARRNSDVGKSSSSGSTATITTIRSSTPENKVTSQTFQYDTESEASLTYGETYMKNELKEKPSSIFHSNGLFINKAHPLFSQTFSRKVFIGGLPRDISIEHIESRFIIFGQLHVDWPNRDQEKTPPNGFAFLHFENHSSVERLYDSVTNSKNRNKFSISSNNVRCKEVEVKFWRTNDCECYIEKRIRVDPFLTVFVGALPRTTTALELANYMSRVFIHVAYAAIDVDVIYGYPKGIHYIIIGAGRVTFANKEALAKALKSHFVEMDNAHGGKRKRIEIKPFISNDQKCDICCSQRCNQIINKYCYLCESFICDNCESENCLDGTPHLVTTRPKIDTISLSPE